MSSTSSIKKRSRVDGGCTSSSKDGDDGLAVRDDELTEIKVSMNRLMDHKIVYKQITHKDDANDDKYARRNAKYEE